VKCGAAGAALQSDGIYGHPPIQLFVSWVGGCLFLVTGGDHITWHDDWCK